LYTERSAQLKAEVGKRSLARLSQFQVSKGSLRGRAHLDMICKDKGQSGHLVPAFKGQEPILCLYRVALMLPPSRYYGYSPQLTVGWSQEQPFPQSETGSREGIVYNWPMAWI
jgi:hypothetical protein